MKRKTIYDVAREAGVSISTVSRALNGTANVKESTMRRIEAACVGYVPNANARELQGQKTKTIGIIMEHSPEYFFMNHIYTNALLGISVVAQKKGYYLLLNVSTDEEDVCNLYHRNKVSGFILMGTKKNGGLVSQLRENNIPFVIIGSYPDEDVAQVDIDDCRAMQNATEYLISLGHARIGIVTGSREYSSCHNRILGYEKAMENHNLKVHKEWIHTCDDITPANAEQLARNLLHQRPRVSAVLAFNDSVAMAVYKVAKDMNIRVPDELSVIGFDDTPLASYMTPMLTSIWQPSYEKGEKAMKILVNSLEKDVVPTGRVELDTIVMYRESCKSPKSNVKLRNVELLTK